MSDPVTHTVKSGEQHLTRITVEHGFPVLDPVWNAPENAELKRSRVNPHTLAVGDVITIPDPDPKSENRATGASHLFTVLVDELQLHVKLRDEAGRPFANRAVRFVSGPLGSAASGDGVTEAPDEPQTDKDGALRVNVAPTDGEAELTVHFSDSRESPIDVKIRILIGFLAPASSKGGQRARLNNMGYFAGFSENDDDQLAWAIEEFEADNDRRPTGRSDDPVVFNLIAHRHGDLLKSEKVP